MKAIPSDLPPDASFQIAPMIDVVFVILVFFMALAGQIRVEQILATRLPAVAESDQPVEFVDEQLITIDEEGQVYLNDEPFDTPADRLLGQLGATLQRLRENAEAAKTRLVVTIVSAENARYGRTIDVLNVCAAVGVTNVSFTVEPEAY